MLSYYMACYFNEQLFFAKTPFILLSEDRCYSITRLISDRTMRVFIFGWSSTSLLIIVFLCLLSFTTCFLNKSSSYNIYCQIAKWTMKIGVPLKVPKQTNSIDFKTMRCSFFLLSVPVVKTEIITGVFTLAHSQKMLYGELQSIDANE